MIVFVAKRLFYDIDTYAESSFINILTNKNDYDNMSSVFVTNQKERKIIMRKILTKAVAGLMVAAMVASTNLTTAEAYSITNGSRGFKKAWELSVTTDGGKGILKYGYNTTFINEDYAHAYHSTKSHYAYLKNGKGSFSGSNKAKKKWSKIEVTHNGSKITYGNSY